VDDDLAAELAQDELQLGGHVLGAGEAVAERPQGAVPCPEAEAALLAAEHSERPPGAEDGVDHQLGGQDLLLGVQLRTGRIPAVEALGHHLDGLSVSVEV